MTEALDKSSKKEKDSGQSKKKVVQTIKEVKESKSHTPIAKPVKP